MMPIPTYDQLIAPLLEVLAAHPEGIKTRDAYEAVAAAVGLTDEDKAELLPSGKQPVYMNRIGWANDRLKRAGMSKSPADAPAPRTWQLTEQGIAFVKEHHAGLDPATVEMIARVPADSTVSAEAASGPSHGPATPAETQTPDARIDVAARELNESLSSDLLAAITAVSPLRFETLVLDVLHAMGYGASRSDLTETVASGDGGIDGVITLDRLGLEKVYVQAKRWTTGTVGRPDIQTFVGALAGQGRWPDRPADGSPARRIGRIAANSTPRPRICPSIRPPSGQIHPEVAHLAMDLAANRKRSWRDRHRPVAGGDEGRVVIDPLWTGRLRQLGLG